jgi:hypothetical protein
VEVAVEEFKSDPPVIVSPLEDASPPVERPLLIVEVPDPLTVRVPSAVMFVPIVVAA